jgi:hypothetical protein
VGVDDTKHPCRKKTPPRNAGRQEQRLDVDSAMVEK